MNTENHITPLIDAYLLGGLDEAEQKVFELHVAGCQSCAAALETARQADAKLQDLFANVQPDEGFEARLMKLLPPRQPKQGIKHRLSRPILHPAVRRISTGVAAALVIGSVGYGMSRAVDRQEQAGDDRWVRMSSVGFQQQQEVANALPEAAASQADESPPSIIIQKEIKERTFPLLNKRLDDTDGDGLTDARRHWSDRSDFAREELRENGQKTTTLGIKNREASNQSPALPAIATDRPVSGNETSKVKGQAEVLYQTGRIGTTGAVRGLDIAGKDGSKLSEGAAEQPVALGEPRLRVLQESNTAVPNFDDAANFSLQQASGGGGSGGGGGGSGGGGGLFGRTKSGPGNGPVAATDGTTTALVDHLATGVSTAKWFKPGDYYKQSNPEIKTPEIELKELAKTVTVPDGGTLILGGQTIEGTISNTSGKLLQGGRELAADEKGKKPDDQTVANPEPALQQSSTSGEQAPASKTGVPPAPAQSEPGQPAPVQPPPVQQVPVQQVRKIIRNGTVTFEVDSFDSALLQVTKIAQEEGGFVATTSSDKLQNGKVKGSLTLRVPPDRLDTLVLKLRGLGDLKNQKISADDVTKKYTDIESQLRAARAMEERLLAIIKGGGVVKDLLEAERQLGVWREKLEMLEGEIRYYNNLISLSTLNVELLERDVRTPTAAVETETVNTAIHADDVEKARAEAIKAIEQAKGRVVDSDLKKLEAGQLSAKIIARVSPDSTGPLIDRLKQLGKVARLDISRKTTTEGGTGPIVPGLRVEKKETVLEIYIYNLANIEPRQTVSLNLAAADVEATYRAIIEQVNGAGGGIVSSQLSRPKPDQTEGVINFQAPTDKADILLTAVRAGVDVMRMDLMTNTDMQNTTEAKRGFSVRIFSLAKVQARENTTMQVAVRNVPAAFHKLLEAAGAAGGPVLTSQLNEQDANNVTGQLVFELPRDKWPTVDAALKDVGLLTSRSVVRSPDVENSVDSKIRLTISLMDEIHLAPRETINAKLATRTVPETFATLITTANEAGARIVASNLNLSDRTQPTGDLRFVVPREKATQVEQALRQAGMLQSRTIARQPDGPMTVESKVGFVLTVIDERALRPRESHSLIVVAPGAISRHEKLRQMLQLTDAQVLNSQFSSQNKKDLTGTLDFVIRRENFDAVEKALSDGADIFNRSIERLPDTQDTVDTKILYHVVVKEAEQQQPRQIYTMAIETSAVEKAVNDLEAAAVAATGRRLDAQRSRDRGKDFARVVVDVPLARVGEVINAARTAGDVTNSDSRRQDAVPEGTLSRAQVEISFSTPATVRSEQGFGESLKQGLSGALTGLFTVLRWVIFGLVAVVPWVLIIWVFYRLTRGRRNRSDKIVVPPSDTYGPTPNPT